jgi:GT2 family glycosyltransferase
MDKREDVEVSILILNYKTPALCVDCIKSVQSHSSGFSYEIVVADNNSNDGIEPLLQKEFSDKVRFYQSGKNLGTARGFNLGKTLCHGRYLFLLNTDTLFVNNAIFEMKQYLDCHPETAVVGGNLYHPDMKPAHSFKKVFSLHSVQKESKLIHLIFDAFQRKRTNPDFNETDKPIEVNYPCAAAALFRRKALDEAGWFSEDRFMYGEEPDICSSFREKGFNAVNIPTAKIIHFEGSSSKKSDSVFSKTTLDFSLQGNGAFFLKWYGQEGEKAYYRALLHETKNKKMLARLTFNQKLISKYSLTEKEIKSYLKDKEAIDSKILSIC